MSTVVIIWENGQKIPDSLDPQGYTIYVDKTKKPSY
jgi:hypothetical protein